MENQEKIKALYKEGKKGHEIAKLTGINRSYVYRVIKKIIKFQQEGTSLLNGGGTRGLVVSSKVNVHAQYVRFFVTHMNEGYKLHPNRNFKEFIPDVNIQCEGKFIYAWCTKKFDGSNEIGSMEKSLEFWNHVQRRLEDRLRIGIGGRGKVSFEFLRQEQETRDSELGKDAFKNDKRYMVYHDEDGKLRLSTDWSDGEINHETHHKRDSHTDSITFNRQMNSILNNPLAPTFGEMNKFIAVNSLSAGDNAKQINNLALALESVTKIVGSILESNAPKKPVVSSDSPELPSFDYIG